MRYYEEISEGETFECGCETIYREGIIQFAEQYDPQPFHVDEEHAGETMFGGLIASGLHTLSVCNGLATRGAYENLAILGGYGIDELRFHEPVYPGDPLSVIVEVSKKHGIDTQFGRGDVDFRVTGFVEDGSEKISWTALAMMEPKASR
jgi:acyl dehydratase